MITIARLIPRSLLLILSLYLAAPLCSAEPVVRLAVADQPASSAVSLVSTNAFHPISPGAIDGAIASATAYMLTNYHYVKKPFDDAVSSQFLDRYLEMLDPQHIHFTQADLADFESYRTNLNHLTLPGKQMGDTRPACEIFNRYMERLQQRTAYADELLQHEKFTFDKDERILINRKQVPYPADLNEAKKLWRERLRFEYLQELLGKIGARKKNLAAATKSKPPQAETNALVKSAAPGGSPARAETRRAPAIGSPKGGEQMPAMPAAAGEERPKAEVAAKPGGVETRVTPLTTSTSVAPSKKTDDEEVVETLSHRYHRTLRFFTEWNNEDVL